MYIHTYKHGYIHSVQIYIHTYKHTYIHTYININMGTFVQYMYIHTYKNIYVYIQTYIHNMHIFIDPHGGRIFFVNSCMYVCMYVQRIQLHLGLSQIPVHLYAVHRRAVSLSGEHGAQGQ